MPTDDLWGELPVPVPESEPDIAALPRTILQEQASLLGSKTHNVLEGVVRKGDAGAHNNIGLDLFIRCSALDNYSFHVLHLEHDILNAYPLKLDAIANQVGYDIDDVGALRNALTNIFQSPQVRRVVSALLREATTSVA